MRLRLLRSIVVLASLAAAPALAQPPQPPTPPKPPIPPAPPTGHYRGGAEQSEHVTQKAKLGPHGALTVNNLAGNVIVTGGSGDEVTIDAVKHARRRQDLADIQPVIEARPGRVDIRVDHRGGFPGLPGDSTSIDFTITVPSDAAVELHSVSGDLKITGVQGLVRAETVSGNVSIAKTPSVDRAKSVSGNVDLSDVASDSDLAASSISGSVHAKGLKTRSLDLNTVSGDVTLTGVTCERVGIRSVSGNIEYDGPLARSGRYDFNSHSGDVRLVIDSKPGFELNASSFSGSIHSDLPLTLSASGAGEGSGRGQGGGGEVRRHRMGESVRGTYGDGSAMLTVRTFSGDVTIVKK